MTNRKTRAYHRAKELATELEIELEQEYRNGTAEDWEDEVERLELLLEYTTAEDVSRPTECSAEDWEDITTKNVSGPTESSTEMIAISQRRIFILTQQISDLTKQLDCLKQTYCKEDGPRTHNKTNVELTPSCRHTTIIKRIIENESDINKPDENNLTLLMHVSQNADTVQVLVDHGADLDAVNEMGSNALMHNIENKSAKVVEKLIECGICVDVVNNQNMTVLMLAVRAGRMDLVKLLVNGGAIVNFETEVGTALFMAVRYQYSDERFAKYLMDHGANVDGNTRRWLYGASVVLMNDELVQAQKVIDLITGIQLDRYLPVWN